MKTHKAARPKKPAKPKAQITAAPAEPEEICGTCHNWRDELCKRYPPEKREGQQFAVFRTTTNKTDWCGEWRAR